MTRLRSIVTDPYRAVALDLTETPAMRARGHRLPPLVNLPVRLAPVQSLCCEVCDRWWPLDEIAMPGRTEFICRDCAEPSP